MGESEAYATPHAVEQAIKSAAREANTENPTLRIDDLIRQAHFDRFLCRIFSEGEESEWVLKGGTGMLARIRSARTTLDIDLYREGYELDAAFEDLIRLASIDLGDHFRFRDPRREPTLAGDTQPYVDGCRVAFEQYIGVKSTGRIQVDLAVGSAITDSVSRIAPSNRLAMPRLITNDYRLCPVTDQVADKVCATLTTYPISSREKDLVDLVLIAATQSVDAVALHSAIDTERHRRLLDPFQGFVVPESWGPAYTKAAKSIPECADFINVDDAERFVAAFIDPVLDSSDGGAWNPSKRKWST